MLLKLLLYLILQKYVLSVPCQRTGSVYKIGTFGIISEVQPSTPQPSPGGPLGLQIHSVYL